MTDPIPTLTPGQVWTPTKGKQKTRVITKVFPYHVLTAIEYHCHPLNARRNFVCMIWHFRDWIVKTGATLEDGQ